ASTEKVEAQAVPIVAKYKDRLAKQGQVVDGSGPFRVGRLRGSVHTDRGPHDPEKPINQDHALAWQLRDGPPGLPSLAVALADGVTTSYASEWGARLACYVGVTVLVEGCAKTPRNLAWLA